MLSKLRPTGLHSCRRFHHSPNGPCLYRQEHKLSAGDLGVVKLENDQNEKRTVLLTKNVDSTVFDCM